MHVVLGVAGYVVIDHHGDVVDVDAACHDVGSYQHVHASGFERQHDFIALFLFQVRVHSLYVPMIALQGDGQVLYFYFRRGEYDDALWFFLFEEGLQDARLLGFVAQVDALFDFLGGFRDGQFHLYGVVQEVFGQFADFLWHSCREEDGLSLLGQFAGDFHDVVIESHIEHSVGLVEHKVGRTAQVQSAQFHVCDESSGCGDDDIGSAFQTSPFLFVAFAVVATIDGYAVDVHVVAKSLQCLVDLSGQFAGRCHDEAVDCILWVRLLLQQGEQWEQVGCRLAGSCLCDSDDIVSVKDGRYTFFLYRCALVKSHVIECVQQVVVKG